MKEIKQDRVKHDTVYEAIDGTTFISKEECEKYELTVKCILNAKYHRLVIREMSEYDLSCFSSDDYRVELVKFKEEKDIDTVMQLFIFFNSWLNDDKHLDKINNKYTLCKKAFDEEDILIICRGYEEEDSFDIYSTRNQLIEHLINLDKTDDNTLK